MRNRFPTHPICLPGTCSIRAIPVAACLCCIPTCSAIRSGFGSISGNGWASGASLAQLQSGFVVAGATSVSSVSPSDRFVVRCNEPGDSLWTRSLGTANQERIHDILPVEDDCLLLVGESASQLDVTKFDSSGSLLWSHTHMAGLNDRGSTLFKRRRVTMRSWVRLVPAAVLPHFISW